MLSAGHARALLAVEDAEVQDRLAQRVVAEGHQRPRPRGDRRRRRPRSEAQPAARRHEPAAPGLADLADRLSDRFETRVKVDLGRRKGKITVEFASLEDLQRIVDMMDPRNREDRPI